MYVCICKAVTDGQLQSAIEGGMCTRRQLFDNLGVGSDCGKCNRDIRHLLQQQIEDVSENGTGDLAA